MSLPLSVTNLHVFNAVRGELLIYLTTFHDKSECLHLFQTELSLLGADDGRLAVTLFPMDAKLILGLVSGPPPPPTHTLGYYGHWSLSTRN